MNLYCINLMQYLTEPNIKWTVYGNLDTMPPFEWQRRLWSMGLKYSEVICELIASTGHAVKLIHFGER